MDRKIRKAIREYCQNNPAERERLAWVAELSERLKPAQLARFIGCEVRTVRADMRKLRGMVTDMAMTECEHISTADRRKAMLEVWDKHTDKELARIFGVCERQVRRDRSALDVQKRRDDLEHKFLTGRLKPKF